MEDVTAESVAVVVVHGVAAHPRYEFQDQCAGLLRDHLNARDPNTPWVVDVLNPGNVISSGEDEPEPTISRVHLSSDDDPTRPAGQFFDVIEAYWSPISKGCTNWLRVVNWILKIVFVPLNTTARYNATWQKQFFDYGYIGGALVLAFALFTASISLAWLSFLRILDVTGLLHASNAASALATLDANATVPGGAPLKIIVWLFVGIVGAFLLGQALAAIWNLFMQRAALRKSPAAILHRVIAITVLSAIGAACIGGMATVRFPHGSLGWMGVAFLVLIFVAFQLGYALLIGFMVGFFGDVQIYTTRDENESRFHALRDKIIDVAVDAIGRAISPQRNGGRRYDRVIVLAHSLGTSIAMDALTQLYQLSLQGGIRQDEFARIRAFITAGASLEKTRYFFDVSGSTPTPSFERWRNDAYGLIFTDDATILSKPNGCGAFWANYWYFQDPICNEIRSFFSLLEPGDSFDAARTLHGQRRGHSICRNERGHKTASLFHPMLHSDYLYDPWFWTSSDGHIGALDIICHPERSEAESRDA